MLFRNSLRMVFLKRRRKESTVCGFSGKGRKNGNKNLWEDEWKKLRDAWYKRRLGEERKQKTTYYELTSKGGIRKEYGERNKEEEKSGKISKTEGVKKKREWR